ncbi:unnamed protein product [Rotaria socialis]
MISLILPLIENEEQFVILRKKLLEYPSVKQILVDKSAATVDNIIIIRDQYGQNDDEETTNNNKDNTFQKKIFIHSLYEGRFRHIQREIHEIHDSFFKNTIYQDIRLIVGHRNSPNIEYESTTKRPCSSLLKNQPLQKIFVLDYKKFNFSLIMDSNDNQKQSIIITNKNFNRIKSGRQKKNSRKKNRKFFQRTKFFGNSLYQKQLNKDMNGTQTFPMLELSIFNKSDYQSSIRSATDPTMYLNDYSLISNEIFKEKFLGLLMDQYERKFYIELFNNEEVLTFTRELPQHIHQLSYFNLQYDQWTYYHQLGQTEVEQYEKQAPLSIDLKELERMINTFIKQDQYRLPIELEQQRHMLKFDAQDHRLIETFYELNERKTEISSTKTIWKATHYEQLLRCELTLFKKWMSLPVASVTMDNFMELGLVKMNETFTFILTNKVLFNSMSTIIVNEIPLKQLVFESMNEAVIIVEKNIQAYIEIATAEKTKILSQQNKFNKLPTVETVMNAIENRQRNMVQRAQYCMEQKIKILFLDKNKT